MCGGVIFLCVLRLSRRVFDIFRLGCAIVFGFLW